MIHAGHVARAAAGLRRPAACVDVQSASCVFICASATCRSATAARIFAASLV